MDWVLACPLVWSCVNLRFVGHRCVRSGLRRRRTALAGVVEAGPADGDRSGYISKAVWTAVQSPYDCVGGVDGEVALVVDDMGLDVDLLGLPGIEVWGSGDGRGGGPTNGCGGASVLVPPWYLGGCGVSVWREVNGL